MSPMEFEFAQLMQRYTKGKEYEKSLYKHDPPEVQEIARQTFVKIIKRMSELWEQMTEAEKANYIDKI